MLSDVIRCSAMFGDVRRCSTMFGDVIRCSAILSELQFTIVTGWALAENGVAYAPQVRSLKADNPGTDIKQMPWLQSLSIR